MPVARTALPVAAPIALDQLRIARRAEADIVREHGGAEDVVVAVDGIRAPDHRHLDRHVGRHRRVVEGVRPAPASRPRARACRCSASCRRRSGPSQDNTCGRRPASRLDLGLGHLADLLLQRHAGRRSRNPRLERGSLRIALFRCGQASGRRRPACRRRRAPAASARPARRPARVCCAAARDARDAHAGVSTSFVMRLIGNDSNHSPHSEWKAQCCQSRPRRKARYHFALSFRRRCWVA
jgi:hypothetical protein